MHWETTNGVRVAALEIPPAGAPGYSLPPPSELGVNFRNTVAREASPLADEVLLNGSGVALGDVDGDGWCDIYLCGQQGPNALYRNRGDGRFEDITDTAGVACADAHCTGTALADLDGDGDLDLLVNTIGEGTRCFLGDGRGQFQDISHAAGLGANTGSMSLALADVDGDGDLDVYVANYRISLDDPGGDPDFTVRFVKGRVELESVNGMPADHPDVAGRFFLDHGGFLREQGEADTLFLNNGKALFTPVDWMIGRFLDAEGDRLTAPVHGWGLSALFHDLTGDGAPELYVCNDFDSVDRLWINDGSGGFRLAAPDALRQFCMFSMGVTAADINGDERDDLFVLDMLSLDHQQRLVQDGKEQSYEPPSLVLKEDGQPQEMRNMLYLNRGDGTYAEVARLSGLSASDWSWTAAFTDVDLDGFPDLLVTTGHEIDARNLDLYQEFGVMARAAGPSQGVTQQVPWTRFPRRALPNLAFRNRGDLTFEEVSAAWGFDLHGVSHGMALADLDNDGDLDVVVNNLNQPAAIYRNNVTAPRLAIRLEGRAPNPQGIGARVIVRGGPVTQSQEMTCGGRYLSSDQPLLVFAAPSPAARMDVEVRWRDGTRTTLNQVQANCIYAIPQDGAGRVDPIHPAPVTPLFADVSARLSHRHVEGPYADFTIQPSLSRKYSQLGPGITWQDVNEDGWDDLLIASGRSGRLGAFLNDGQGGFTAAVLPGVDRPAAHDQTALLGWPLEDGHTALLVGNAGYEDRSASGPAVQIVPLRSETAASTNLPGTSSSTGPLALGDVDGDGDLDLFVGGRIIAGRYPAAASSRLYRAEEDQLVLDEASSAALQAVGLVSSGIWTDLDADGLPELVLACEWGPVRVFGFDQGVAREETAAWGLEATTGWWNSVSAGDFNGDGRMDLVAGNWGRNSEYQAHLTPSFRLYWEEVEDGPTVAVESYLDPVLDTWVPRVGRDALARAAPFLGLRRLSHQRYAEMGVHQLFGRGDGDLKHLDLTTFDSMVFLNQGGAFTSIPLPVEAQFSPVFGLCVGDLNGDGAEDVFLAQNFFHVDADLSRQDAGSGLCLLGDGRGGFRVLSRAESGIALAGAGRGAALADYDFDGRVDLAVGQNESTTALYHNRSSLPGLGVEFHGPSGNPDGVGAQLRVKYADGQSGPMREVRRGNGYWSQDAPRQVLGTAHDPVRLWWRWPGGSTREREIPAGARNLAIVDDQLIVL